MMIRLLLVATSLTVLSFKEHAQATWDQAVKANKELILALHKKDLKAASRFLATDYQWIFPDRTLNKDQCVALREQQFAKLERPTKSSQSFARSKSVARSGHVIVIVSSDATYVSHDTRLRGVVRQQFTSENTWTRRGKRWQLLREKVVAFKLNGRDVIAELNKKAQSGHRSTNKLNS
jgi:hypothetical protein